MSPVQINNPGSPGPEDVDDPVDALLACHARIREFTELSLRLAQTPARPGAASAAAAAVVQYFTEALPAHEADEDLSLAPRLRAAHAPDDVLQALDVVSKQHPDLDRVIARILPSWQAVAQDERKLPALAEQMARSAERIALMWTPHLTLEESAIFPVARTLLDGPVLLAIRNEMRERRNQRF